MVLPWPSQVAQLQLLAAKISQRCLSCKAPAIPNRIAGFFIVGEGDAWVKKLSPEALEILAKAAIGFALSFFVVRVVAELAYSWPQRFLLLGLMAVGEILILCLVLAARMPTQRDRSPLAIVSALVATFYFMAVALTPGKELAPLWLCTGFQITGIALQIAAKAWLGRNFGLLPAVRGIVTTGPYSVVRHPIYLGYFLAHVGFLLGSFSKWNLAVYSVLYLVQGIRVIREEKILATTAEYRDYMLKTRWRFIPLVF